jgi:hypothetical protein
MPYICLARTDIPDGTLQVLDLQPNASQRTIYDPPAQTRYLKRPRNTPVAFNADGTLQGDVYGLAGYLLDRVEAGGTLQAGATVTCAGVQAGDTVTIAGVVFSAVNGGAVAANQTFDMSGTDIQTATSLVATITDAASIALMVAGSGLGYAHAVSGGTAVVTLSARYGAGLTLRGGPGGDVSLASSNGTRLALNTVLGRLFRAVERWTVASLTSVFTAIMVRVDGALPLALANINTALAAAATGTELTNAGGSRSVGTVADVLSILSGRQYLLPRANPLTGVANDLMSATNSWDNTPRGGFTVPVLVNGTTMEAGEIRPLNIGGDVENRPVGPYTATYDGGAFQRSLATGQLAVLAGVAGMTPVTLFPNSSPTPVFPWNYFTSTQAVADPIDPVTVTRVVTVYDDAGAVLA